MSGAGLKDRLGELSLRRVPHSNGWPELNALLLANPVLNGDAEGFDTQSVAEAVAVLAGAGDAAGIARLRPCTVRAALSAYWAPEHTLHDLPHVTSFVSGALGDRAWSRTVGGALFRAALMHWDPESGPYPALLRRVLSLPGSARGWRAKVVAADTFEAGAAERLGSDLLGDGSAAECFARWGLGPSLQHGRFAGAAFASACRAVERSPDIGSYRKLWDIGWMAEEKRFRFADAKSALGRACLRPWRTGSPPDPVRRFLTDRLREAFGDPRMHRAGWVQIDAEDERVFKRWLANESLSLFLDIVGKDAEARMWDYRRAFWEACFRRELIDEAWVAFGTAGWRRLQMHQSRTGTRTLQAGRLSGATDPTQSVLFMKMGPFTLVEWSHNGQIWFLDPDAKRVPKLYRSRYRSDDCRGFSKDEVVFSRSHNSPESWSWQRETSDVIKRLVNVRVDQGESMPRGRRRRG